jgi:hypothetical protein
VAQAHGTEHKDSNNSDPAIHGNNTADGPGLEGTGVTGPGVHGLSNGVGVEGESATGIGVHGKTSSGLALLAEAFNGTGLRVDINNGTGVRVLVTEGVGMTAHSFGFGNGVEGSSHDGNGVRAFSMNSTGLSAESQAGDAIDAHSGLRTAVRARADFGTALEVQGPAKFSTAGSGTILASQDSLFVDYRAVTAQSHITVTLTGNPGVPTSGLPPVVLWVERRLGDKAGFVVHMTRKVGVDTPFTYLVVEPAQ